eukprot:CAMPEP_0173408794 /NCGR_PEP_ID=MMETSP1356-20130122/70642_1 /TAXON_ID=77927 ORGANISM="Hemiselmis virescens, Strain PCC157" /NCGR_SAMPLE_ID=MMETSP1356 /ASSEMBLY_ACC=CAM_ASM_000847 /LENGTH=109 /DNA_ID=CAMNT_0014370157 /DNA_START=448 /DNA_END=777 /DNA_ORIENTATION=-
MKGRLTSRYGKALLVKMALSTTSIGSCLNIDFSLSLHVSLSAGSVAYMPPGDLKSGMPAATEMPAPVRKDTFLHASEAINLATPEASAGLMRAGREAAMAMVRTRARIL